MNGVVYYRYMDMPRAYITYQKEFRGNTQKFMYP